MGIRIALFALPTAAVAGIVVALNILHADPGVATAALGLVVVVSGAALGFFADRLPDLPHARRKHALGHRDGHLRPVK